MKTRIILADDHKILREGLRTLLERQAHFEVVGEADTGLTTIRLVKELKPDIVIMDITMPEVNGVEVTRRLRDAFPGIKVLALSVHSDSHYVARMFAAGASGYLRKDCASKELILAINRVLDGEIYLSPRVGEVLPVELIRQIEKKHSIDRPVLTPREHEVLRLVAEGKTTKQIAGELNVTVKAIEKHRQLIMEKLDLHSVAELTQYAIREGIIPLEM